MLVISKPLAEAQDMMISFLNVMQKLIRTEKVFFCPSLCMRRFAPKPNIDAISKTAL
jgi:hypothetical protein